MRRRDAARHAAGNDEETAGAVSFDPFADLLLGLIAILVPVISLLLTSGGAPGPAGVAGVGEPGFIRVVATAGGLRVEADAAVVHSVPLTRILDDAELARRLREARDRGQPLLLDIAADGLEAAFLFEPVAARNGPPLIRQRRLEARGPGGGA